MLRDSLAGHVQSFAQVSQGLPIFLMESVEKLPAVSIRQSLENRVISHLQTGNQSVPYMQQYYGTAWFPVKVWFQISSLRVGRGLCLVSGYRIRRNGQREPNRQADQAEGTSTFTTSLLGKWGFIQMRIGHAETGYS